MTSTKTPAEALAYCRVLISQQCPETARQVARECLAQNWQPAPDVATVDGLRFYAGED